MARKHTPAFCDVPVTPHTIDARATWRTWRQTRSTRPDPEHPDWGFRVLGERLTRAELTQARKRAIGTRDRKKRVRS